MPTQNSSNSLDSLIAASQAASVALFAFDAQTANANAEVAIFTAPASGDSYMTISGVSLTFSAAVTAAATNLQTFTLNVYNAAGTLVTTGAGTAYATSTAATAFKGVNLLTTPVVLKPGYTLTLKDAGSGTGAVTPLATVTVQYNVNVSGLI